MRLFAACAAVALCAVACGQPADPAPPVAPTGPVVVNPERIARVRTELPTRYEASALPARSDPAALWGFGAGWAADPAQCGILARPVADPADRAGWSASGPGGIVYAVATGTPSQPVGFDPELIDDCAQWTMWSGHTSGSVTLGPAPGIEGAASVAMTATATTVVEGGTETRARAETAAAYLGGYVASITVVTDPGSPNPQLGADFAAELLVKTVAALRG